jgi:putative ABC transport system permease protein
MSLLLVAWKNLRRKKIRSVMTVSGVAIAVAVLVSLLGFDAGYQRGLQTDIDRMGYQVLVTAKGCPYEAATLMLKGGGGLRYMDEEVYARIVGDARVDQITPQLMATAFDPDREGGGGIAMYIGITDSYLALKPWVAFRAGGWFSGADADEVLMGYEAAELEQRAVGDQILVPGADIVLTVAGIFDRTGTQDDGVIFMPLNTAQRVFELPGKITGIGIKLREIRQLPAFEEDLYNEPAIQVVSMAQVKGTIFNLMSSAKVLANSIAVVAIFIAVIGVTNTILMSVLERTKEIGVMKALGASRTDVFRIVWMETAFVCLLGGAAGIVFAFLGGGIVERALKAILPYAPTGRLVVISLPLVAGALAGAVVVGLVAGIYPALRAAAMRPVEAIRSAE